MFTFKSEKFFINISLIYNTTLTTVPGVMVTGQLYQKNSTEKDLWVHLFSAIKVNSEKLCPYTAINVL